jgi:hypothetical protein
MHTEGQPGTQSGNPGRYAETNAPDGSAGFRKEGVPVGAMELDTEEQVMERVAEILRDRGLDAYTKQTGGGIVCVIVESPRSGEGRRTVWGTADVTWAADVVEGDGANEVHLGVLKTEVPSDSTDAEAIADAIAAATKEP